MYYHALRVHLQVTQWKTLNSHAMENCLNPVEWGWKKTDESLESFFRKDCRRKTCQNSMEIEDVDIDDNLEKNIFEIFEQL